MHSTSDYCVAAANVLADCQRHLDSTLKPIVAAAVVVTCWPCCQQHLRLAIEHSLQTVAVVVVIAGQQHCQHSLERPFVAGQSCSHSVDAAVAAVVAAAAVVVAVLPTPVAAVATVSVHLWEIEQHNLKGENKGNISKRTNGIETSSKRCNFFKSFGAIFLTFFQHTRMECNEPTKESIL